MKKDTWTTALDIQEDWDALVAMKVQPNNPESLKAFKQAVATFYWKGVHLMVTPRGNSQKQLELHYILYQLHGLEPPAPSRRWILPDCVALCSTPEEFLERYDSCWDWPAHG